MGLQFQLGRSRSKGADQPRSLAGKLFLTLFLSIFVIIGGFVSTLILGDAQSGIDQQGWVERPCTIVSSEVTVTASDEDPYEPRITYTYTHGGRAYRGSTVSLSDPATRDYRDAQAIVLANPVGSTGKVFVNPDEPSEATLKTDGLASLGSIAFLIVWLSIFSGIPLCIIVATWWPRRGGKEGGKAASKAHEARRRGKEGKGWIGGLLFGTVFGGFGAVFFFFVTAWPTLQAFNAKDWVQRPCVVERSELLEYPDSEGDSTYLPDVLYRYEINGQTYRSNRYDFAVNDGRRSKGDANAILGAHPVGKQTVCYVDPADPGQAVLSVRTWQGAWWGSIGGVFALVGLGLGIASLRSRNGDRQAENDWRRERTKHGNRKGAKKGRGDFTIFNVSEHCMPEAGEDAGPVVLRPGKSRLGAFIGLTFFALIWNGIVSVFVYHMVGDLMRGEPDYCGIAFMVPFVLVGLGSIGFAGRQLMLVFAPKVVVELDRRALPLGGATKLRWHVEGGRGRVERVRIKLIGEERATYTRGTDTVTDTHAFYEQTLVGEEDPDEQNDNATDLSAYSTTANLGDALLAIPQDSMHSFEASNNVIAWKLEVLAQVAGWPDPKDSYDLTVQPMPTGTG